MLRTKNINVNVHRPPVNIPLGRQGENLATCIIFDCTGLVQLYGDGTAELLHELKSGTVYPVAIQQDGASVSWAVSASDTAIVGSGRAELRWYVGDTLAKSAKFRTSVSSALADSTTETPPEPQQSWVDKVLQAAQEIKDGAISDGKLAAAIAAYLEEHPIDAGLDEAALAAYLTGNGYLTDAALADAVAHALAEAKASGQFDGAPGKDGTDGAPGADGADGVGIQSVVQTTTSAEDGGTNVITVTKTDGTTSTFQVKNGSKGNDGAPGADGKDGLDGPPGADGKSAYQYAKDGGYTGTEAEFATKLAAEKFANPNALTFTGAVTGSYDGSAPVSVEIPSSGSGGKSTIIFDSGEITEEVNLIGPIDISKYSRLRILGKAYPSENSAGKRAAQLYFGNANHRLLCNAGAGRLFDTSGNPVSFLIFLDVGANALTSFSFSGYNAGNTFNDTSYAVSSGATFSDGGCLIYSTSFDLTQMYLSAQDDLSTRPWGVGTRIMVIGDD